jgi:hypothetical protein
MVMLPLCTSHTSCTSRSPGAWRTNILRVSPLPEAAEKGKVNTNFTSIHPDVVADLPQFLRQQYGFTATHRAAVDDEVMQTLLRMAGTGRVPFLDCSKYIAERRASHVLKCQKAYFSYQLVRRQELARRVFQQPGMHWHIDSLQCLSEAQQPLYLAEPSSPDSAPSSWPPPLYRDLPGPQYLTGLFMDSTFIKELVEVFDHMMAGLDCRVLKVDWVHKMAKQVRRSQCSLAMRFSCHLLCCVPVPTVGSALLYQLYGTHLLEFTAGPLA